MTKEELARCILKAMDAADIDGPGMAYINQPGADAPLETMDLSDVTIDGRFDMHKVADAVIQAMASTSGDGAPEANWVNISRLGSHFEEQIDVSSIKGSMRHRPRRTFSTDPEQPWVDGPAPILAPPGAPDRYLTIS